MIIGIVSISVSALIALLYVIFRLKTGTVLGTFFSLLASFSFIAAGILSLLVSSSISNTVYAFVLLALSISFVGDILVGIKDDQKDEDVFLNLGMIMFAAHKILLLVALISLIGDSIHWLPFTIGGAIAIAATVIIMTIAKAMKLDFKYFFLQICCYFFIMTYLVTLAVWYAILLPQILVFSIATVCFLFSDIVLLRMHLGKKEGKTLVFWLHNLFYFGGQLTIVGFLYFSFFNNF